MASIPRMYSNQNSAYTHISLLHIKQVENQKKKKKERERESFAYMLIYMFSFLN